MRNLENFIETRIAITLITLYWYIYWGSLPHIQYGCEVLFICFKVFQNLAQDKLSASHFLFINLRYWGLVRILVYIIMGFWNSLMSEAGSKTGKAIGNKLFGRHASDEVIRIEGQYGQGNNGDVSGPPAKKSLWEMLSESAEKFNERVYAKEDNILDLDFDPSNNTYNIQLLFKIMAMVDAYIQHEDDRPLYNTARSKFATGLMMVQMVDPESPAIAVFQNKLFEWDNILKKQEEDAIAEQKKSNREFLRYILIAVVVIFIMLVIAINSL